MFDFYPLFIHCINKTGIPHLKITIIIRLMSEHPSRAPLRSALSNSECPTDIISLIRNDKKPVSSCKAPTLVLWPIQPDKQTVPQTFTTGVKRPGRKADRSPSYNVEVKNDSFTLRLVSNN